MKRILVLVVLPLLFAGCEKEDAKLDQDIWLLGYKALSPNSDYEKTSVEFLFFPANNGEKYKTESKTFEGTISDYQTLHDDEFDYDFHF